ncbi:PTS sugar transporter subunit IIA [Pectinatus frisingensis]|uniref:PTS sugar transporter subunit IIA n=1 Tax=Pectinatus frisingensis TaxID=865 RepID=UPI0018C79060|nr:PTS sugar transporter subunit IIA [Pectinatus frisingensis]
MENTITSIFDMNIKPEYLFIHLDAVDNMDAIKQMAVNLAKQGVVKNSFIPAVLERERIFSTGLQFDETGIAIPHTDTQHINSSAISIAILKKPVTFQAMGMPDSKVNVEIIFMLAIKTAHGHIKFLQTLMNQLQNKVILHNLINSTSKKLLINNFKSLFNKEN